MIVCVLWTRHFSAIRSMFRSLGLRTGRADIIRFRLLWRGRRFNPYLFLVSLLLDPNVCTACWDNERAQNTTNYSSYAILDQASCHVLLLWTRCPEIKVGSPPLPPTQGSCGRITDGIALGYDQASNVYLEVAC